MHLILTYISMVRICNVEYNNDQYNEIFSSYPFPLSNFQKYAIEAIHEDKHVLVTAHTGSGKTLPAEHAIKFHTDLGKRVIYTSPIKALSNQKYEDLNKKFPGMIGLLTGDITRQPDAPVLIMTTEILRSKLRRDKFDTNSFHNARFTMNIEKDLGCVIFDEVHYFSDRDRGIVWEECLMFLPQNINLVLLSATLANPMSFAKWIENDRHEGGKQVYLATTDHRVVPLEHYGYITIKSGDLAMMKDKKKEAYSEFKDTFNALIPLKDKDFLVDNRKKIADIKSYFFDNRIRVHAKYVLNTLLNKLYDDDMMPCICFVLNKELLEDYANSIERTFFEPEEKIPNTIEEKCEHILRSLDNYKEYVNIPAYINLIKLLKKGIAIHHASMLPVLREMVEKLLSEGIIKVLFCTETFAVGLNMPVKTSIMTSLTKFDGTGKRFFHPSEYTQMAGRAGRRGIDVIGRVIHLNNLFDIPEVFEYKNMLCGSGITLTSKYSVMYDAILFNAKLGINIENIVTATNNSYANLAIMAERKSLLADKETINAVYYSKPEHYDETKIMEYMEIVKQSKNVGGNARKKIMKQLIKIKKDLPHADEDEAYYVKTMIKQERLDNIQSSLNDLDLHFRNQVLNTINALESMDFINNNLLTERGEIALHIQELPGTVFADLILTCPEFHQLSTKDFVMLLSLYNNTSVKDVNFEWYLNEPLTSVMKALELSHHKIINMSAKFHIIPFKDEINKNMLCIGDWLDVENEEQALAFIATLPIYGLQLGDFAKAVLKIVNIIPEMLKVAEITNNIEMINKLNDVPSKLSKFFVTTQSLYV